MLHFHSYISLLLLFSSVSLLAQVNFIDASLEAGIHHSGSNIGIAVGDYDNDGDEDVYISRQYAPNVLYKNNGDGTFADDSFRSGTGFSGNTYTSIWGDLDNDGDLDLYIGNINQPNKLYQNNGNGTFRDISFPAGVGHSSKPRSILLADVDQDGFLDIYIANLLEENVLYHNNGDMTFTDITAAANVMDTQISMGAIFFDYDNDHDLDLYLTHDADQANILYQNDGTGHFTDVSVAANADHRSNGMGVDVADINHDGWLDIYITNLSYNTLLLNQGDGTFTDISQASGAVDTGMGWGTTFLDYDNDGYEDIYMVNDSRFTPRPNVLYHNEGDMTFMEVSENTSIASMGASYGSVSADFNQDGLLDLMVTNQGDMGNQLFINDCLSTGNWLQIKALGTTSNRSAIGSRITLEIGSTILLDEIVAGSGYSSQNSLILHFGLGDAEIVDKMTIRWANGLMETYENISANQLIEVIENEGLSTSTNDIKFEVANINIFPNPSANQFHINLNILKTDQYKVQILDTQGRLVEEIFNGTMNMAKHSFIWNAKQSTTSKGGYFLKITSANGLTINKLIIK